MFVLNLFTSFIESYTGFAVMTLVVSLGWVLSRRFRWLQRVSQRHPVKFASIDLIFAPLMILMIGSFTHKIFVTYNLPHVPAKMSALILLALLMSLAWCLARLIELYTLVRDDKGDVTYLPRLQRGLLYAAALFVSVAIFIYVQGYSIKGLYISTGAVAALLAFAMQQTLGDLFSGIALSIEHPFKVGEWIRLADGSEGKVVDINWRATRLLTWNNTTLVVPNNELAKQGFTNLHGAERKYAPWYEIKLSAEIDPRHAQAVLLDAALKCTKVLKDPLPVVRLLDATTVPYTYMVWVHFANYTSMFAGREQLFQEIHSALKDLGVQVSPDVHELRSRRVEAVRVDAPTPKLTLKTLDFAKSLMDGELEELAAMCDRETFDAGTILLPEGEISKSIDVILHGVVETSVATHDKGQRSIDQLRSGAYFGLTSTLMDTKSFMQFRASTNVTLIRIPAECLQKVFAKRPDLHDEFAIIMKQRMDRAQEVRAERPQSDKHFTLKDFLRRVEQWTH